MVNLPDTPLIAAEDTFVAADMFVADIVNARDDVELKSVNLPEVALTAAADTEVVNLASGEDNVVELTLPALKLVTAEILVPLIVGARAEVELRSVNLADTPLMAAEDTLVAADMFVADIVGAKEEVELRLVNLPDTPLIAADDTLVTADILVAEIFCINADGADTADNALNPLAIPDVPDNVTP